MSCDSEVFNKVAQEFQRPLTRKEKLEYGLRCPFTIFFEIGAMPGLPFDGTFRPKSGNITFDILWFHFGIEWQKGCV